MNTILKNHTSANDILKAQVDEYVMLDEKLKAVETLIERRTDLKKILADVSGGTDQEIRLVGDYGYLVLSKPVKTRTLKSIPRLLECIGLEHLLDCITVSTTKVDKLLTNAEKDRLFEVGLGSRRLKEAGKLSSLFLGSILGGVK